MRPKKAHLWRASAPSDAIHLDAAQGKRGALARAVPYGAGMEIDPDVLDFYADGREHQRLTAEQSLELIRTQILIRRYLPEPCRVLDVGGGAGVYAGWLSSLGYDVELIDPVPLHVDQARALGGFSAEIGDARDLARSDETYDGVLVLGPLYHLINRTDRVLALCEARRVVRPGGVVVTAGISRYAGSLDPLFRGVPYDSRLGSALRGNLRTGEHRNPDRVLGRFTTAYFHRPDELAAEIADAGLRLDDLLAVEDPLGWVPDISARLANPDERALVLDVLAAMESDPSTTGVSAHLLAAARR